MLWEDDDQPQVNPVPLETVDLAFAIDCRQLPVDHSMALSQAICDALPWVVEERGFGLHLIHIPEQGNGWMRSDAPESLFYLSKRTRLTLRLPIQRVAQAQTLSGQTLTVAGQTLRIGQAVVKPLRADAVLFSRYVLADEHHSEEDFLTQAISELEKLHIHCRKLLANKAAYFRAPEGIRFTRGLMIADLDQQDSLRLQVQGLGPGRELGYGLFTPHKGIAAVKKEAQ